MEPLISRATTTTRKLVETKELFEKSSRNTVTHASNACGGSVERRIWSAWKHKRKKKALLSLIQRLDRPFERATTILPSGLYYFCSSLHWWSSALLTRVSVAPRAYEYALMYPPDGANHPLFAAAKSKPHEDVHITRAAHCTAMQVAVYHAFNHDYASRHRKDLSPEDSICPCGLPYTTYHVVYECPRYSAHRRQFRLDRMGEHDLSVLLGSAPMSYYNNHSDRIHGEFSTLRRAAQSFLMFLQTSKAFSRPVPELPDPSPRIFDPG